MTNEEKKPVYMRPAKVAKYFDVSEGTIWRWMREDPNFPKPKKLGMRVTLLDVTAVEAYMKTNS